MQTKKIKNYIQNFFINKYLNVNIIFYYKLFAQKSQALCKWVPKAPTFCFFFALIFFSAGHNHKVKLKWVF